MKILFTGGGTGGHFYPIIAVAEEVRALAAERKLLEPSLYYVGPTPYDEKALFENGIEYRRSPAGKFRRYFSLLNIFDLFKTAAGIAASLIEIFGIYPDAVLSKGGYASFPTVLAARLFRIPLLIHESDTEPGRVNRFAARFAERIAISYSEAARYFPAGKTALTGNPVRKALRTVAREGAHEFLKLSPSIPVILVLGGSQGAQRLNEVVVAALPELILNYQVIHQTGEKLAAAVEAIAGVALEKNEHAERHKIIPYLNELALRMAAGAATVVVSRAGSGAIFEIAQWGIPSILVPLLAIVSHDQLKNAFAYARSGAAVVIEEGNLTPHLLVSEINRLMSNAALRERMSTAALSFARPNAARTVAEELIEIALKHESR